MRATIIVFESRVGPDSAAAAIVDLEMEYAEARSSWDRVLANPSGNEVSDARRNGPCDFASSVRQDTPRPVSR